MKHQFGCGLDTPPPICNSATGLGTDKRPGVLDWGCAWLAAKWEVALFSPIDRIGVDHQQLLPEELNQQKQQELRQTPDEPVTAILSAQFLASPLPSLPATESMDFGRLELALGSIKGLRLIMHSHETFD